MELGPGLDLVALDGGRDEALAATAPDSRNADKAVDEHEAES